MSPTAIIASKVEAVSSYRSVLVMDYATPRRGLMHFSLNLKTTLRTAIRGRIIFEIVG